MRLILIGAILVLAACGGEDGGGTDAGAEPDAVEDAADGGDVASEPECTSDEECSDGLFCNGEERCLEGACADGDPALCDDEDLCTEDSCLEEEERCLNEPLDADDDGYAAETGEGGIPCGGNDCDDSDPDVNPGARLDCLGDLDLNCNDVPDWQEEFEVLGADVRVTDHIQAITQPVIAWSGSLYGITWSDERHGDSEIYFARLDEAGAVVGSELRLTDAAGNSNVPRIGWSGSEYGIAWQDTRDLDAEIYFTRVGADGTKIGADVRVTDAVRASAYADIAWTGSAWGLAWQDSRRPLGGEDLYFQLVGADGALVGANVQVVRLNSALSFPRMTWSGSEFAAAWGDNAPGNFEVYFARMDGAGSLIGSELRVTDNVESSGTPSIAWTGSEYGIAWTDARDGNNEIYMARVSAVGVKLSSDIRITDYLLSSDTPDLEWTGRDFGLGFVDHRDGTQIWFVRIAADGTKRHGEIQFTLDLATSLLPSLAWNGSGFGISWADYRHDTVRAQAYFKALGCQ